jgi:hypothetical protein
MHAEHLVFPQLICQLDDPGNLDVDWLDLGEMVVGWRALQSRATVHTPF